MQETLHLFFFYRLPVFIYCILIFVQSSFPASEDLPSFPMSDKVLHLFGYALLGALFLRALKTFPVKDNIPRLLFLSILFSTLYGFSDEFHQSFVAARSADVFDAVFDFIGSALGVFVYYKLSQMPRFSKLL